VRRSTEGATRARHRNMGSLEAEAPRRTLLTLEAPRRAEQTRRTVAAHRLVGAAALRAVRAAAAWDLPLRRRTLGAVMASTARAIGPAGGGLRAPVTCWTRRAVFESPSAPRAAEGAPGAGQLHLGGLRAEIPEGAPRARFVRVRPSTFGAEGASRALALIERRERGRIRVAKESSLRGLPQKFVSNRPASEF